MIHLDQYGYPGINTAVKYTSLQCTCCSQCYNETQKTLKLPFFLDLNMLIDGLAVVWADSYRYRLLTPSTISQSSEISDSFFFVFSSSGEFQKFSSSNIWLHTATDPNPLGGDAEEQHSFLSLRTQVWVRPPWPIHRPSRVPARLYTPLALILLFWVTSVAALACGRYRDICNETTHSYKKTGKEDLNVSWVCEVFL